MHVQRKLWVLHTNCAGIKYKKLSAGINNKQEKSLLNKVTDVDEAGRLISYSCKALNWWDSWLVTSAAFKLQNYCSVSQEVKHGCALQENMGIQLRPRLLNWNEVTEVYCEYVLLLFKGNNKRHFHALNSHNSLQKHHVLLCFFYMRKWLPWLT